jgi:hypothetical protein
MSRQDQYLISATFAYKVNGQLQTKSFARMDTFSGGEVDSEETKFNPGGLGEPISLGGRKTVGNVTIGRLYDAVTDHPNMGWLMGGVGKADVTVTKTLIDIDGNALANPLVYKGKLKTITPPEFDSESSDAALWEAEISSATVTQ